MAVFEYKGSTKEGKSISGTLQADSMQSAKDLLKKDHIFLFEIKDRNVKNSSSSFFKKKGVDIKTLCNTTRMLATMLKANVPLVESLSTASRQLKHPVMSSALTDIRNLVNEGHALHKALRQYPHIFDTTYISLCEAGETAGNLDQVLLRLAQFTEDQSELSQKIKSALYYPVMITFFTFGITIILFTYVIPEIAQAFEDQIMLPWYTQVVMNLSHFLIQYWHYVLFFLVMCAILLRAAVRSPNGKKRWDQLMLDSPVFGPLIRSVSISRFSRTLSTLLNGGVPMLEALTIVQNVTNNSPIKQAIINARSNIREGQPIAKPLEESGQFPPMTIQMIQVGEKTGELENMLERISGNL